MSTLPVLTRTIDDDFVNTWYEIKAEVEDNIMESNVVWLALREFGVMDPQEGGEYFTETVGYGKKDIQRFVKGSVLDQNEVPLDTMARWDWTYFLVDVNRTLTDDQKNRGPSMIKSYVARRLEVAKESVSQDIETMIHQYGTWDAIAQPKGLYDVCAPHAAITVGTSGGTGSNGDAWNSGTNNGNINRTNTWWRNWAGTDSTTESRANKILAGTAPFDLNLRSDMAHIYNMVTNGQASPNFILASQNLYEAYEDEVSDKQQVVRTSFDKAAADLGFETLTFKGATFTYSNKLEAATNQPSLGNEMLFLNMDYLKYVYDPGVWFDMTEWRVGTNAMERVAYITCAAVGLTTNQPRRHGYFRWAS